MTKDKATVERELAAIVLRHTVIGGYPNTIAIARDAYKLASLTTDNSGKELEDLGAETCSRPADRSEFETMRRDYYRGFDDDGLPCD